MPLSAAVTPTLGGAGWLLNLTQKHCEQLPRLLAGERAAGEVALVEREQVLVEVAGVEGVPGVQLGDHAQVDEPVGLQRLPEIARRVRRHVAADLGDLFELGFALRRRLRRRPSARPAPRGARRSGSRRRRRWPCLQFLLLVVGLRVVEEIEACQAGGHLAA